ncbi:hypothetical protein ACXZ65_33870 [Streptomyces aculeolatus]
MGEDSESHGVPGGRQSGGPVTRFTHNSVSGHVYGPVVQAGVVHGDVRINVPQSGIEEEQDVTAGEHKFLVVLIPAILLGLLALIVVLVAGVFVHIDGKVFIAVLLYLGATVGCLGVWWAANGR